MDLVVRWVSLGSMLLLQLDKKVDTAVGRSVARTFS